MKPPLRLSYRHYELVEINGPRKTVIDRYMTRFEAYRAKKMLEGPQHPKLIVRYRWQ